MSEKIAKLVVKYRTMLLVLCLLAAVAGVFSIRFTRINYDLTSYLGDDTMTKRGLKLMEEEFGESAALRVMFDDFSAERFDAALETLNALPGVAQAAFDQETGVREKEGRVYRLVSLTLAGDDELDAINRVEDAFSDAKDVIIAGAAASTQEFQQRVAGEVPLALGVSVAIVLLVLFLTSHAWIEPLLIIVTLLVSIVVNLGTNFIFPSISFITYAVSAILQLALSMDYAIMLLHGYQAALETSDSPREAVQKAVRRALLPVSSSALTTVAGLMSLAFMSFSIGLDIGLVLSKGVLLSLITVFLLMPALLTLFSGALKRTSHRAIKLGGARLGHLAFKARRVLPPVMAVIILAAFALQTGNTYIFSDMTKDTNARKIAAVFGESSALAVMVPKDERDAGYEKQRALIEKVSAMTLDGAPAANGARAMVTTGAAVLEYYTPETISERFNVSRATVNLLFTLRGWGESVRADALLSAVAPLMGENAQVAEYKALLDTAQAAFNGEHYARIVFDMNMIAGDTRARAVVDDVLKACADVYGDDYFVTGELMSAHDIGAAFDGDLLKVNLITVLSIFLIVLLSFRSLPTALLLVAVIEGSIWITMAIFRVRGEQLLFMAYLICVAILMGATIDYAILLTSHYRRLRKTMEAEPALCHAMERAVPTILTSGAIFIGAGAAVGTLCSVFSIYTIGAAIARGAFVSVLLVLFLLPALLARMDRFVAGRARREKTADQTGCA